jgi:deoxyribonuclease V
MLLKSHIFTGGFTNLQTEGIYGKHYNMLIWKGKQVGLILRTQKGIKPLYVSPGHRVTWPECLEITLGCVTRYRLPLPVRQANLLSRRLRA